VLACSGAVGWVVGYWVKQWFVRRRVNEDLAVWDYVKRHPEDFPEIERKISSILLGRIFVFCCTRNFNRNSSTVDFIVINLPQAAQ